MIKSKRKKDIFPGDLVVHIGAKPNGYRARLVADVGTFSGRDGYGSRAVIYFADGNWDWLDQWRIFSGWKDYEGR